MECKVGSVECKVWSVKWGKCGVESGKRGVESVECKVRSGEGWNVTKCHTCHAKRHDNLLGNLQKGVVLQLPT